MSRSLAPSDDPRVRVLGLLQQHGRNATSFQVLEDGFRYWFGEGGCVAYVDTGGAWVAAGAPIGPLEKLPELVRAFALAAKRSGRRACFFATEGRFEEAAGLERLLVGEQPVWEPAQWSGKLREHRSLREQLRRARAKGVVVRLVGPDELQASSPLRGAIAELAQRWLRTRAMAPMRFLVDVQPLVFVAERRVVVALKGERLVGVASAIPVYGSGGWFLEHLIRDPEAPNGTAEMLVDFAMRLAARQGSGPVTLGLAPLSGGIPWWLRAVRTASYALYDFRGLRRFKAKFRPDGWQPVYLAWPEGGKAGVALLDALTAFAGGSLVRFGLTTLIRGPRPALEALAISLVPWTALLATADGARWFPHPWEQVAWTAFDLVLLGALSMLVLRWKTWLAAALAMAVTLDAALTWTQLLSFNAARASGLADWAAIVVAGLGPLAGAAVLWGALGRKLSVGSSLKGAEARRLIV